MIGFFVVLVGGSCALVTLVGLAAVAAILGRAGWPRPGEMLAWMGILIPLAAGALLAWVLLGLLPGRLEIQAGRVFFSFPLGRRNFPREKVAWAGRIPGAVNLAAAILSRKFIGNGMMVVLTGTGNWLSGRVLILGPREWWSGSSEGGGYPDQAIAEWLAETGNSSPESNH